MQQSSPVKSLRNSCDPCRKAKTRCKMQGDSCIRCLQRGKKCTISFSARRKAKPNRRGTIDEMKNRIERMESLLSASGLTPAAASPATDSLSPLQPTGAMDSLSAEKEDKLSMLVVDRTGFSTFIGSSSGFSFFSPCGLQWVSDKTGNTELSDFVVNKFRTRAISWSAETAGMWQHLSPEFRAPIPPKDSADILVDYFFEFVNPVMPVYNKEKFMRLYERQYSANPPTSLSWYASLNIALALGSLLSQDEVRTRPSPADESQETGGDGDGLSYLRNCYSVFTKLSFSCRELMSVQAFIGMAFMLDMLLDVEACYVTLGAAARLSAVLGLHRKLEDSHLPMAEITERRNVFWVLYIFDKVFSLRLGRPPTISDDDIEIDEPDEDESQGHANLSVLFPNFVRLSKIASEIYSEVYSTRAGSKSALEKLKTIDRLDRELTDWRDSLPEGIQPEKQLHCSAENLPSAVILQFEYYNCLSTLHRSSSHRGMLTRRDESSSEMPAPASSDINLQLFSSHLVCLSAARHTAKLLITLTEESDQPRDNLVRRVSYYPLSAFLTLFANVLMNPQDPCVSADVHLLDIIVDYLRHALAYGSSPLAGLLSELFQKMRDVAEAFVNQTHLVHPSAAEDPREESNLHLNKSSSEAPFSEEDTSLAALQRQVNDHLQDTNWNLTGYFNTAPAIDPGSFLTTSDAAYNTDYAHLSQSIGSEALAGNPLFRSAQINSEYGGGISNAVIVPNGPFTPSTFDWDLANLWMNLSSAVPTTDSPSAAQ